MVDELKTWTFRVTWYRSFLNPGDPYQTTVSVTASTRERAYRDANAFCTDLLTPGVLAGYQLDAPSITLDGLIPVRRD